MAGVALLAGTPAFAAKKFKVQSVVEYRKCMETGEAPLEICLDALNEYVKGHPGEAFAAGKAVRATMNHSAAVPFFAKAFAKKGDSERCGDEDVAMALTSGLALPPSYKETVSPAQMILFDRCWEQTNAKVMNALSSAGPESALAENLCSKLRERKQANSACAPKASAPAPVAGAWKWKELDPQGVAVEEPAKVFKGGEGKVVAMARVKGSDDAYLIRFDGFRGPWNGRVILHREQSASSGYDYYTSVNGARWVSIVARGDEPLSYEVYPSGDKGPIRLAYDEQASKTMTAKSLLDQFAKQQHKK